MSAPTSPHGFEYRPSPAASRLELPAPSAGPHPVAGEGMQASLPSIVLSHTGPLTFEASAPGGDWLSLCQAREDSNGDSKLEVKVQQNGELVGDKLQRYLVFASGSEFEIEDLWLSSPSGSHVVVKRAGKVELWDVELSRRTDLEQLSADVAREPAIREGHRTLSFSGDALFYVRRQAPGSALVEHSLSDAGERVLWQGPEPVVRMSLEGAGRFVVLWVPGRDANNNGRFDWPFRPTLEAKPCRGPVPRFVSAEAGGDPLAAIVIDRFKLEAKRYDDLALVLGDAVVRRDAEGALFLQRSGERAAMIADKGCAGRVLWAHRSDWPLLLGCVLPKRPTRLGVEVYRAGQRLPLEIDVAALGLDEVATDPERLVALYPGADTVLFDTETRALHRLNAGDAVLSTWGPHALVRRGRTLVLFDVDVRREAPLPGTLEPFGSLLVTGPLVYASPLLVDVASGTVLGQQPGRALALARAGQLLVAQAPATDERLAEGPLAWRNLE